MTRNGKIARLPREVREALNRRLHDGEPGKRLVAWLNRLPKVRAVLRQEFAGRPLREQNLSEWKKGGYAEWLARQEALDVVREMTGDTEEFHRVSAIPVTEQLALWLAARYARATRTAPRGQNWRWLREFCHDLVDLRRGDHSAERLRLERERFAFDRERDDRDVKKLFATWLRQPKIRKEAENLNRTFEERVRFIHGQVFGMPLDPARETPAGPMGGSSDPIRPNPSEENGEGKSHG